jgi:LmbE family N-acetylglucosaminyl deacetylase
MKAPWLDTLSRCDSVYLSPHADDAVLACTERIRADKRRGLKALIVTFFEGDGSRPDACDRSRAGRACAEALGAEVFAAQLTAGHPDQWGDDPPREEIERAARFLADLMPRTRPESVYAPLAVASQTDHRLVHDAALLALANEQGRNLFFYEDRPEALIPGAVRVRLGLLGARLPPGALHVAESTRLVSCFLSASRPAVLRDEVHGLTGRMRLGFAAIREWRVARRWNPLRGLGPRLQPVLYLADADALDLARRQAQELLGGARRSSRTAARFVKLVRAYSRRLGAPRYAERVWLVLPEASGALAPLGARLGLPGE